MDEVAAAPVDERAIEMASPTHTRRRAHLSPDLCAAAGIMVHRYTSVYININQVELRLGMNMEIHSGVVLQRLVDDRCDLVFRERHQLAGVRDGVARLIHSQLMLKDCETSLRDWSAFIETAVRIAKADLKAFLARHREG